MPIAQFRKNSNEGHRKRLRQRFLQNGLEGFLDYEIIELLLTLGTPRKDCKQMAKAALKKFGSLNKVLYATIEELHDIKGIGSSNVFGLKLFQSLSEYVSKSKIDKKINFYNCKLVAEYLQNTIGRYKKEHFIIIFLNTRHQLIKSTVSIGSLNSSIVHPREVFKEAIQASAAEVIIGHNHPSNDPTPSPEDVGVTRQLQDAARIVDIKLIDHIIVTTNGYSSLKELDLM